MFARTLVFVDTSYLLASFYNSWEEGARGQLEISLATVVQRLNQHARALVDQPVQRQYWYDGIPDSGPHRYQRTLRVIDGVQLRAGQLIEWGDRRTQKAVDTLLVADMIQAAYRGQCSDMVLVSGDADMIPGVRVAVEAGVRVHLIGFGWDSISSALRHACDTSSVLDPRDEFADAMQIRVLEGPVPPQVRTPAPAPSVPGGEAHDDPRDGADMVGVAARSTTRASAESVADEARLTAGDEERAADIEDAESREQTIDVTRPVPAPPTVGGSARDPAPASADTATSTEPARPPTPRPAPADPAPSADVAPSDTAPSDTAPSDTVSADPDRAGTDPGTTGAPRVAADTPRTDGPHDLRSTPGSATRPEAGSDDGTEPATGTGPDTGSDSGSEEAPERPKPSMMAPHRRPLRSKFVPLSDEVWTSSGEQTPHDVGRQYAVWWFDKAASATQRDEAHLLSGGALPPEIDRPLLQFACQVLSEFTLSEEQRVHLRDGFHEGIRTVLLRR